MCSQKTNATDPPNLLTFFFSHSSSAVILDCIRSTIVPFRGWMEVYLISGRHRKLLSKQLVTACNDVSHGNFNAGFGIAAVHTAEKQEMLQRQRQVKREAAEWVKAWESALTCRVDASSESNSASVWRLVHDSPSAWNRYIWPGKKKKILVTGQNSSSHHWHDWSLTTFADFISSFNYRVMFG